MLEIQGRSSPETSIAGAHTTTLIGVRGQLLMNNSPRAHMSSSNKYRPNITLKSVYMYNNLIMRIRFEIGMVHVCFIKRPLYCSSVILIAYLEATSCNRICDISRLCVDHLLNIYTKTVPRCSPTYPLSSKRYATL